MKRLHYAWSLLLFLLVAGAVSAADVNGKWKIDTPREMTFDFKADGAKLGGTVTMFGKDSQILEGQINGAEISFAAMMEVGGGERKLQFKGKVADAEIQLNIQVGQMSADTVAKRI